MYKRQNIANPDDYLTLVKKGFYLNDYEPKDLVELDSEYVAPTCDHPQLRKVAAEALVKMIKDAKKEGMYLLLNSGYRSYEEQEKIYQETEQKYGGAYAAEYVATPGLSLIHILTRNIRKVRVSNAIYMIPCQSNHSNA